MRFSDAEERYRELEAQLIRGELKEDDFLTQISQLRVVDKDGRRWMLSSRTGRWLVHDGQQWVFAEPPDDTPEPEPPPPAPTPQAAATTQVITAPRPPTQRLKPSGPASFAPRVVIAGIAALLLVGCLIGGGVAAWVFLLRDWSDVTPAASQPTSLGLVQTYTPRPSTPTYTPTFTPTPSRTPTPTLTPIPTNTPRATNTPLPADTPLPTNMPTPTWTPLVVAVTTQPNTATPAPTVVSAVSSSPTAAPTQAAAPTPVPASGQTYTVEKGDTLFEIALRFGVSVEALAKANGISNTKLIRPGQVLVIPVPGTTPEAPTATARPTKTPSPSATPRVSSTATPRASATRGTTATATPTRSGPTATPKPTQKPKPTATATPKPVVLSGKIAFTVWNPYHNKYELYVSRIDGSGRNMLGEGFRQPQFRQDGNLLAVNGDGAPNFENLVTMDASGGNMVEVSNHAEDSFPTWSADGAIVAYSSNSWGDGLTRLGIVHDMFGKQQEWIRIGTTEIQGEYPFWMADGRVVYHGCDFLQGGGACSIYWVGAGGGNYHRLSDHESDTAPAGSQGRVAFMSSRDGNWEIYVLNMDGGGLKRLTNNGAQDGLPTWSPDGKSIAFVSNRGGAWAIWVMDANGGNQRKLFDLGGGYSSGEYAWTNERISWAP